jgi:hypothetical protein
MKSRKHLLIITGIFILLLQSTTACQANSPGPTKDEIENLLEESTEEFPNTEAITLPKDKPWDLLWVSDSSGWGVAEIYGQFIAEDNGVEVNVIDSWIGGLSAGEILQGLTTQDTHNANLDNLREIIAEAEIIVIYGNPEKSINPGNPGDWLCGQPGGKSCYVNNCAKGTFSQYIEDLTDIYEIIFEIRQGKPTIIRAIDAINPGLVHACEPDIRSACTVCWETYNDAVHEAADQMGIPIANIFDAWNGLDHTEDPVANGYTQEDNIHPNELGATVIAQVLRDLGYEPIIP